MVIGRIKNEISGQKLRVDDGRDARKQPEKRGFDRNVRPDSMPFSPELMLHFATVEYYIFMAQWKRLRRGRHEINTLQFYTT
jgi:hypothetical protein